MKDKINLAKPTQEQVNTVFNIWTIDITSAEDLKQRVEKTRDYLSEFDCKDIWKFKFGNNKELGVLILKQCFYYLSHTSFFEDSTAQTKTLELLKEKGFSPIDNLSQESRDYLETVIIEKILNSVDTLRIYWVKSEKLLIEFIEKVGLFKDLSKKSTLSFAKSVVASNSIHLLKWLFSRGLSPDMMVEQDNDKLPLASFSPTMDMLNVFISHGIDLTSTSKNGVPFSILLSNRNTRFAPFVTEKDRTEILCAVYKAEMATQTNPQELLWRLVKKATSSNEVTAAILSYENVCDLRDEKGRHIVQFAMIENPYLVNTILSVNEKTLALGSAPDKHGRLPYIYWIASDIAQAIEETNRTSVIIPKQINEEMLYQATELTYELKPEWISLFSNKVQKRFERTTGKKLDEWIEEEAANGNPWFEHMIDIAVERAKKGLSSPIFLHSNVINIWADPDNQRVVNEAHALFRAHLMLVNVLSSVTNDDVKKQSVEQFFKKHIFGKTFDTLKHQINNGVSFMGDYDCVSFTKSHWWKKICALMEREELLKRYTEDVNAPMYEYNELNTL